MTRESRDGLESDIRAIAGTWFDHVHHESVKKFVCSLPVVYFHDHRQYSVFMTNRGSGHRTEYGFRWEIESGYWSIKRFMAATTSKDFGLRFFYFAFACLLYSIWRAVDLLVQAELTEEYEHSPIVIADNTLTLLKKETGIG